MNFYAYRLMIRQDVDNHLLRFRRLLQQYCVDMYVKIETERLNYIRFNQLKLRSEEYINLRDAISSEGNGNDIMTYVRNYGRPDLFITITCNPKWIDITQLLLPRQTSSDRHDITARVFRQKLKTLICMITKHKVFGDVFCGMAEAWLATCTHSPVVSR